MPALATTTIDNGLIAAEYTVTEARNGDVTITCRVPGSDVFRPDTFRIPADLRAWVAAAIAPRTDIRVLTTAPLADQMRALSQFLPLAQATQLDLLAVVVGRMERTLNEVTADAAEDVALRDLARGRGKVVPISAGITRRFL